MTHPSVLAVIIVGSLILYTLTGGADYGGGMWDLLAIGGLFLFPAFGYLCYVFKSK